MSTLGENRVRKLAVHPCACASPCKACLRRRYVIPPWDMEKAFCFRDSGGDLLPWPMSTLLDACVGEESGRVRCTAIPSQSPPRVTQSRRGLADRMMDGFSVHCAECI